MNIKFQGHQQTEREVELSQKQLHTLFECMKDQFLKHIEFGKFDYISQYNPSDKNIVDICNSHDVDPEYTKDRLNFFKSIVQQIPNPYQ